MRCAALLAALNLARWARVAVASLGLPTVLAVSGDRKKNVESKASEWGLLLVLKVREEGELGMMDLCPGDLEIHTGRPLDFGENLEPWPWGKLWVRSSK